MERISLGLAACVVCMSATVGRAEPLLQLYVEGATYNSTTESWEIDGTGFSPGTPIRLWAIGNVGAEGTIFDVKLAIAYSASLAGKIGFEVTSTRIGGTGGYSTVPGGTSADPSTPSDPIKNGGEHIGDVPKLGDGSSLPSHSEYGSGTAWQEFKLGDFTSPGDSPLGDFSGSFPTSWKTNAAKINAYEIVAVTHESNLTSVDLHFDLYDHVQANQGFKYKFAPFSHDASAGVPIAHRPEPSTLVLLGIGGVALLAVHRRRRAVRVAGSPTPRND